MAPLRVCRSVWTGNYLSRPRDRVTLFLALRAWAGGMMAGTEQRGRHGQALKRNFPRASRDVPPTGTMLSDPPIYHSPWLARPPGASRTRLTPYAPLPVSSSCPLQLNHSPPPRSSGSSLFSTYLPLNSPTYLTLPFSPTHRYA